MSNRLQNIIEEKKIKKLTEKDQKRNTQLEKKGDIST
jgi:hypothetical protein